MAKRSKEETQALLTLARQRFEQASQADQQQRQRELDDLAFYAGTAEAQWGAEALKSRAGMDAQNGMPPVPARPCFVINKVKDAVRQVLNQERQSDMGIELAPADDFASIAPVGDDTEIELREGLCRRIQRSSEAADARTWAFTRSTIAGRGFYSILTRFAAGKTWDKEIFVNRIFNQASVSLDPNHQQPDGSDAEWGFIGTDLPWAEYKAEFPTIAAADGQTRKNDAIRRGDANFRALGDEAPGWFTQEKELKTVRVVDYLYTERVPRTLCLMPDGSSQWKDELADGSPPPTDEREVVQKQIKWAKIDGIQILEETDWEGPDLPIVKVLGEELQPFDNERRSEGMVRQSRDAQKGFNSMVSKWVETIGLAPIAPWMATQEQVAGYEKFYQASTTRALPVLFYNAVNDSTGQPIGPPTRTNMQSDIAAFAASVQMFDEAIQSTTGVPDSRVGRNVDPKLKSGKAIQLLRDQSEQGTSNYLDNLKRSIRYEGQIINNLLYPIYGQKPGRLVRIVTGEGEAQTVAIGALPAQFSGGSNGASPNPLPATSAIPQVPPGAPPRVAGLPPAGAPPQAAPPQGAGAPPVQKPPKVYQLTEHANFNVIVKVTRSFDSRRTEEATLIGDLLQAEPQLMTWFGDLFFKNQDGPGHQEMADRAKLMLAPPIQQMLAQQDGGEPQLPPQAQQMIQQLKQRVQHAEQVMQVQQTELEKRTAETQAKIQIATMQEDHALEIAKMNNAAKIEIARITAAKQTADAIREDQEEAVALRQTQTHEAALAAADAGHEELMAQQAHQQNLEAGAQGIAGQSALADQSHGNTLEQQQQAAELTPEPAQSQNEPTA